MVTDPNEPGFLDHLDALRTVLLKILLLFAVLCIPGWYYSQKVLELLLEYAAPKGFSLHYFTLMEPFLTRLKIMLVLALTASIPGIVFWVWGFIFPGLLPEERKALKLPILSVFLLAVLGALITILFVVPALVHFSLSFAGPEMKPVIGIGDFVSMILIVILAGMGLFQFPVVLYILLTLGIVNLEMIRSKRPHIIVVIFILAAVFSPPDVMSQLLLAIPTWILFEISLFLFSLRKEKKDTSYDEVYKNADLRR